ncbi:MULTISPECIES: AtuA-related protein [unclassified Sphingomonas]|uniref:AtuA-related protein n=1 Tax=Novosphingobium rhizosphaerae TaxID=1551649 RepID=UPI0015CA3D89
MQLRDLAHARTGDKGDTSQICVFVRDAAQFARLERLLSAERVAAHLATLRPQRIERFVLPNLGAVNFVLHGVLSGGVTRSLALDAHGKTLGAQLLDMEIDDA